MVIEPKGKSCSRVDLCDGAPSICGSGNNKQGCRELFNASKTLSVSTEYSKLVVFFLDRMEPVPSKESC